MGTNDTNGGIRNAINGCRSAVLTASAGSFKRFRRITLTVVAFTLLAFPALIGQNPAGATSIPSLKAEAAQLAQRISAQGTLINVLSERYDQARLQLQSVEHQLAQAKASLAQAVSNVQTTRKVLRSEAINAYVDGNASNNIQLFLSANSQSKLALRSEYMSVAAGGMTNALDRLHTAIGVLSKRKAQLSNSQHAARSALATVANSRQAAITATAHDRAMLSQVKGRLATLVAQAQAAQQAAQAQPPVGPIVTNSSTVLPPSIPSTGSGAGEAAVRAAESQLGVPYVWGGATPGVGFDCSGLVMWAWSQAGVSLPHYSGAQFNAMAHVPLADIQPGDVLFYGPGGSQHEAMYVGPGTMIQAEQTGTNVMFTPIWYSNLAGVGQP
ncbi:MAG: NlpC/P60 family protein [Actinomycetota bacterium]|nr:NlpC/P60 family protein [Actinomycetota bacterium]